jgi:hypothetical protein
MITSELHRQESRRDGADGESISKVDSAMTEEKTIARIQ